MSIPDSVQPSLVAAQEDDRRWAAVLARDGAADGAFVFAVSSTGIYCRPSCPARRPKRSNVRYFPTPAEAEAAGFRPCQRCRPQDPVGASPHLALVVEACRRIADQADAAPSLAELARSARLSPGHFQRVFKTLVGLSPRAFAQACRGQRLREALTAGSPVTEALYAAGYGAPSRMYAQAEALLGMAPGRYRQGGPDESIVYGLARCSLGLLLVARSGRGVCALTLGDDEAALIQDLAIRFPRAQRAAGQGELGPWLDQAVAAVEAPAVGLDLPLDLRGTAFQQRVWQALRATPAGASLTYAELAAAVDRPGAARAVGSACGANPVAVGVPCHRVVRADGGLGGYRWGLERKAALRAREGDKGDKG
ncbi:MAG: bifunctional DNA-binding transcriptional regulator/O6-methylguanine-DNA methyltransferase Ada [Zoogloeaceae bacterium]|nr:bifunctional DNA-binding transcriptional regulator/O6-methylguanine-DNA methyltransferase Ada [Zoogloeaceae bacterium]